MAEDEDRSSKTEAPTKQRLDEARRQGDVVKAPDVGPFAALAAVAGVLTVSGGSMARGMAQSLLPFIEHPDAFDLRGGGGIGVMRIAMDAAAPILVVLFAAAVAGVAGNLVQHGLLWVPSKLAPDFSKLNPVEALGRMFGIDSLMQFLKSLAKIAAVSVAAYMILQPRFSSLQALSALAPAAVLPLSAEVLRALVIAVLIVFGVIAAFDWFWQYQRYMQRMRMSREEIKQDNKDSEGDPHIKARQRQLRMARSKKRMIQNVPKATMVVMNPTHFAVALRYVQGETPAPICVAKGLDGLALRIRSVAEEHSIPVIEDPPLARALYGAVEVDEAIPRPHYEAVAKIIGFIMSAKRRGRGRL